MYFQLPQSHLSFLVAVLKTNIQNSMKEEIMTIRKENFKVA